MPCSIEPMRNPASLKNRSCRRHPLSDVRPENPYMTARRSRDILAYLRVLANPADDISVQRIIPTMPKRAIGDTTVNGNLARHTAQEGNAAADRVHGYAGEPERPRAQERGEIQRELMMSLTMM